MKKWKQKLPDKTEYDSEGKDSNESEEDEMQENTSSSSTKLKYKWRNVGQLNDAQKFALRI